MFYNMANKFYISLTNEHCWPHD